MQQKHLANLNLADVDKLGIDKIKSKIKNIEDKIPNITNLATNASLTAVENKIPDHSEHITTPEFNNLTGCNFGCKISTSKFSKQK